MNNTKKLPDLEAIYGHLTPNGMIDRDYKDGSVRFLRFAGGTCPICGSNHWCQINATGTKVVCQRELIKDQVVNGFKYKFTIKQINGYLYELVNSDKAVDFDKSLFKRVPMFDLASPENTDLVYRLTLLAYKLSDKHMQTLLDRGLTEEEIKLHGSRGFGTYSVQKGSFEQIKAKYDANGNREIESRWENALQKLGLPKTLWHGVPGFSRLDKKFSFPYFCCGSAKNPHEGILVPYYNVMNRLVGFQVRVDRTHKYAKIEKPLKGKSVNIKIDDNDNYSVHLFGKTIAEGNLDGRKRVNLQFGEEAYSFKVDTTAKYYWVSSKDQLDGANNEGKLPVQVAYNPTVAQLDPNVPEEREMLKRYIAKPKSVWLTEGGLKGYVTACKLQNAFSSSDLDKYGRDVLAVAGVNSYRHFLPILKQLNVKSVTCAYDMDMLQNDEVADNYTNLVNMLKDNSIKVNLAVWDPDKAKGIDDALVANVPVTVSEY